ncbi:MAG: hypothetical protein A2231_09135 [Candidatus Firestonebacteria bacterium RIFOXYA2_FULL_40_8]|nr:MAG: hypothetical protein A2231_09135 [Candidatus Firestonebacteria bacterium RIFOXYA2_FULL_40_8]
MPRAPRKFEIGVPQHITQRGNNKQIVFKDREDRKLYLSILKSCGAEYNVGVLAYCLMNNHVHLILVPKKTNSLSLTFWKLNTVYAKYFNNKYSKTGHLWSRRYHSKVLNENHLAIAIRYVDKNPVRAGLVEKAEEWEWSSARYHLNNGKSCLKLENIYKFTLIDSNKWKEYFNREESQKDLKSLRFRIK